MKGLNWFSNLNLNIFIYIYLLNSPLHHSPPPPPPLHPHHPGWLWLHELRFHSPRLGLTEGENGKKSEASKLDWTDIRTWGKHWTEPATEQIVSSAWTDTMWFHQILDRNIYYFIYNPRIEGFSLVKSWKWKMREAKVQSWLATLIGIYRICDEKITCWFVPGSGGGGGGGGWL